MRPLLLCPRMYTVVGRGMEERRPPPSHSLANESPKKQAVRPHDLRSPSRSPNIQEQETDTSYVHVAAGKGSRVLLVSLEQALSFSN